MNEKSLFGWQRAVAWTIAGLILVFSSGSLSATTISSNITSDTTWSPAGNPYIVTANVTVVPGVTLTVQPGVVVQFNQYVRFVVQGTLLAVGSPADPIVFTGSTEAPGWWQGIHVTDAGAATIQHASIHSGGYLGLGNLYKKGSGNLSLANCTLAGSSNYGLKVELNSGALSAVDCSFSHNDVGVWLGLNTSSDFIGHSCFFGDNVHDVAIQGGNMTTDATWALNSAYSMFLEGNLTIGEGATLTVSPGTVLKSSQFNGIFVDGTLSAGGVLGSPIYFTDHRDDSVGGDANGDGIGTEPAPAWWRGIEVRNAGSATLDHVSVRYGGYISAANLAKSGSGSLALSSSTLSHSSWNGLAVSSNTGSLSAVTSRFSDNVNGVWIGLNMSSDFIDTASVFTDNTHDVAIQGGNMAADATWALNSAYSMFLEGILTVGEGATLTVSPGTVVKSSQFNGIFVDGTLLAEATTGSPIYFTDHRDDTVGGDANGDGGATAPEPMWWRGIDVRNSGSATLDYVSVRYGGYLSGANLVKSGSGSLTLNNSVLRHSSWNGLKVTANSGPVAAAGSTFHDNEQGVWLGPSTSSDFIGPSCVFTENVHDVAIESGNMAADTTWRLSSAYSMFLTGNLTVLDTATLTVSPGTVVKAAQYIGLFVDGILMAEGTAGSPIHFTDHRDDSVGGDANGDADATAPEPMWWRGIDVRNTGSASLDHVSVRYGGYISAVNLAKSGSGDLTLTNSALSHSSYIGLKVIDSSGNHVIRSSLFDHNQFGIHFTLPPAGVVVSGCRIESNSEYGIWNGGPNEADARYNWWGHPTGPYHPTINVDGLGDPVSDFVLFEPWKTSPVSSQILSPLRSGSILAGDSLRFLGLDPNNATLSYLWTFGDGRESTLLSPGLVGFHSAGSFEAAFSLVDSGGSPDANPDTRNLVVVADTGSVPDLKVTSLQVPANLSVGQSATIDYRVANIGDGAVSGAAWQDALYLSKDEFLDIEDPILATTERSDDLAIDAEYQGQFLIHVPTADEGQSYLILSVDDQWAVLERHQLNNEVAATTDISVPLLDSGVGVSSTFDPQSRTHYYRIDVPEGMNIRVVLDGLDDLGSNEIYVRYGTLPTIQDYDYRASDPGSADQQLLVPASYPGTWYILIYNSDLEGTGQYDLVADVAAVMLFEVTPSQHGDSIDAVLTLTGGGFASGATVELSGSGGPAYPAASVEVDSFTQITATFTAGAVPPGLYTVRVTQPDGSAELPDAFEMLAGGEAVLETNLIVPSALGYHQLATIYVEYANTGEVAMMAPLLIVTATQNDEKNALLTLDQHRLTTGFWTSAYPDGFSDTVLILASGETPGILQPGESARVPVYYAGWLQPWDLTYPPIVFSVAALMSDNTEVIDWNLVKTNSFPSDADPEAFDVVWNNFVSQVGNTWGDYVAALAGNASYLGRLGPQIRDADKLHNFELQRADAVNPYQALTSALDASASAPGLDVTFTRVFYDSISSRYSVGALGRGWSHWWDRFLAIAGDGTVTITAMGKYVRAFQPDSRGGYFAAPGDYGTLTDLGGGAFRLLEQDGTVIVFRSDGKIGYVADANGNRITCAYSGELLTGLTHDSGQSLQITYNSGDRIASIFDSFGHTTDYTYDAADDHLVSVRYHDGRTITYEYFVGDSPVIEHALKQIGYPNGTHDYFQYDAKGRLSLLQGDGGKESYSFAYGNRGGFAVTNALGETTEFLFDHRALLAKVVKPSGSSIVSAYDAAGNLLQVVDPVGYMTQYEYDRRGNRTSIRDPLGYVTQFSYDGPFDEPTTIIDPRGQVSRHDYDNRGNLLAIINPDYSSTHFVYDALGSNTFWTNHRGQIIEYLYDIAGRVTSKIYEDDSHVDYTYDNRDNLTSTTDASGTTTYAYDSDGRLASVAYPGDLTLQFTYDVAGRRSASTDQLGNTVHYEYDDLGHLESISDSIATIVSYTYDDAGQLIRKSLGNGVFTEFAYDANGNTLDVTNYAQDATVVSWYSYGYDGRDLMTSASSQDGVWTYEYDGSARLIRATFDSANVQIADQELMYEYDAMGNRVRVLDTGALTSLTTNSLNQYTDSGDTFFEYDADGNLTQEVSPQGTTTFTYDEQNRLAGMTSPQGAWEYVHDALGNRVVSIENGVVRRYVIDPIGRENVTGEYDIDDNLIATRVYGLNLVGSTVPGSSRSYYTFDGIGNTSEMISGSGAILNAYAYRPFGEIMSQTQSVDNPFRFAGEFGVMAEPNGLSFMRGRYYQPRLGRFLTRDPVIVTGRNPYNYARANPLSYIDPDGRQEERLGDLTDQELVSYSNWRNRFRDGSAQRMIAGATKNHVPTMVICTGGGAVIGVAWMKSWICPPLAIASGVVIGGVFLWTGYDAYSTKQMLKQALRERNELFAAAVRADPRFKAKLPKDISKLSAAELNKLIVEAIDISAVKIGDPAISQDPNQKLGPAGFGEAGYIKPEGSFAYRVDFENDPDATAPAQVVTISDQLHPNVDWNAFELTEIGFGDHLIPVPAQTQQFEYTEPMSVDGKDIEVQIHFQLNLQTGELSALFASIDPATGLPPPVTVGFLPPEDGTGRGQGHFGYLIRSRAGLVTGDEIRNIANITFDFGETIATNQVDPHDPGQGTDPAKEAPNTIDAEGPTSAVNALPATSDLTFEVTWSGDDGIGSGVAHYTIYVQENGGAFAPWLVNTPATSDQFTGSQASVYGFYSIATDNVGHVEPPKTVAESTTAIDALDTDGDGLPDAIDPDDDNDGVDDEDDLLPLDPNVGANDCSEYDEIIEDRTFDYGESYACQAPGSIIAQGAVTVGDGAYVYLEAPNVRLDSVFRVAQEGVLRVAVPSSTAVTNTQIAGQPVGANESADAGKKPGLERTQSAAVGGSGIPQRLTSDQLPAGLVQRLRNIGATVTDASSDASGRYVVLATDGPLVDCDRNGVSDVYWYDQLDDWLTLVSAGVEGWAGSGPSTRPRMDRDGTMVVYQSEAGNLIVGDGNGVSDIFRYDPVTGFTERVSWTLESGESAAESAHPALDAAGTQILYDRFRTEGFRQIFGYEPQEFATELVSLVEDPEDGQALDNHHPGISPDGRYVVYLEGKPANAFEPARCAVHFYDQEDGLYARVPCPREISGASEHTPFFSADAASVEWVGESEPFGLGTDQPPQSTVVVENPLLGY